MSLHYLLNTGLYRSNGKNCNDPGYGDCNGLTGCAAAKLTRYGITQRRNTVLVPLNASAPRLHKYTLLNVTH